MTVVCISGKAGHGKDAAAGFLKAGLEERGCRVLIAHFADILKYVCRAFFGWDGVKDAAGRSLLQRVGTDVIRARRPDYFADFLADLLALFPDEWDYVLIPDCRFPNEFEVFPARGMDAILLRVERPGYVSGLTPEQRAHPSETAMDRYGWDVLVVNGGTLEDLEGQVRRLALPALLRRRQNFDRKEPCDE